MYLSQLALINFRNHSNFHLKLDQQTLVIVGPNGAGKTNILETIYLLSTGDTFRDNKIEELVKLGEEVGHVAAKVLPEATQTDEATELRMTLTRGVYQGKRVAKRRYQVNNVGRSKAKFVGYLPVICFRPEDLRIVEGSPARRRSFLDETLMQTDRRYAISLSVYSRALRSRNKILEMIREGRTKRSSLDYYDQTVIEHGHYLHTQRQQLINYCNQRPAYPEFGLSLEYDHSVISRERLDQYRQQELATGYTLVGPHRDDISIKLQIQKHKSQSLQTYGSRGQQRMGVLWLKLMALEFVSDQLTDKQRPLLLLDDIFSELDNEHRQLVFDLCDRQQTIVTTADQHYLADMNNFERVELT